MSYDIRLAMSLRQYISENYEGVQNRFAEDIGVARQQITQWLNAEYIVIGDDMYSPRRDLSIKKSNSGEK